MQQKKQKTVRGTPNMCWNFVAVCPIFTVCDSRPKNIPFACLPLLRSSPYGTRQTPRTLTQKSGEEIFDRHKIAFGHIISCRKNLKKKKREKKWRNSCWVLQPTEKISRGQMRTTMEWRKKCVAEHSSFASN